MTQPLLGLGERAWWPPRFVVVRPDVHLVDGEFVPAGHHEVVVVPVEVGVVDDRVGHFPRVRVDAREPLRPVVDDVTVLVPDRACSRSAYQ